MASAGEVRRGSAVTRAGKEGPRSFHNHGEGLLLEWF